MALSVTHTKVSAIADDAVASAAGEVLPSDWNAAHTLSGGTSGSVLFVDGGGAIAQDNANFFWNDSTDTLTLGNGTSTVTAFNPVFSASQTWNNAAVAFTGSLLDITNTASAAGSLLQDWQVGGVSKVSIDKTGLLSIPAELDFTGTTATVKINGTTRLDYGVSTAGSFTISTGTTGNALFMQSSNTFATSFLLDNTSSGGHQFTVNSNGSANNPGYFAIVDNTTGNTCFSLNGTTGDANHFITGGISWNSDTYIFRDGGANAVGIRNGGGWQSFRVYAAYTSGSNYQRGVMDFQSSSANSLVIGTQNATAGVLPMQFIIGGVNKLDFGVTTANVWTFASAAVIGSYTVATLPTGVTGMYAYVTDGTGALAWGATVTGGSTAKYLVWYNGANWTVAGK